MRPPLPTMVLLPLGTLLQNGTYRLEQLAGHRGWQLTYEGTHLPSQQPVLIETLNPSHQSPDEVALQRSAFLQQAHAWQRLKHPSLEPIRDVFVESVLPFLIKDKFSDQTWATLAHRQPLSETDAIAQITQIADGLNLAHQHHLLHGDIQPAHVVLHPQTHHPMLVNWICQQSISDLPSSAPHAYAAPEVSQGQQTVVTDIYGLAATLYTLVTGQVPIAASQRQQVRLDLHSPALSQATVVAILRGMAMQPQHRPQSVLEWLALLPKAPTQPVPFSTESGNIGAASPSASPAPPPSPEDSSVLGESSTPEPDYPSTPEETSAQAPLTSNSENIWVATPSASTVPLEEPNQIVSPTRLQPYAVPPRFPVRVLVICSILSGVVGIAFGLLLRFHYQTQFTNPPVPSKAPQVKNEDFLPKPGSTRRPLETVPAPTSPSLESPTSPPLEGPLTNPQVEQGGFESDPSLQESAPLAPAPSSNPELQSPVEVYPDSLTPNPSPSPFDPFSTPDFSAPPPSESSADFQ